MFTVFSVTSQHFSRSILNFCIDCSFNVAILPFQVYFDVTLSPNCRMKRSARPPGIPNMARPVLKASPSPKAASVSMWKEFEKCPGVRSITIENLICIISTESHYDCWGGAFVSIISMKQLMFNEQCSRLFICNQSEKRETRWKWDWVDLQSSNAATSPVESRPTWRNWKVLISIRYIGHLKCLYALVWLYFTE